MTLITQLNGLAFTHCIKMEGTCLCGRIKVTIPSGLEVGVCRRSPPPPTTQKLAKVQIVLTVDMHMVERESPSFTIELRTSGMELYSIYSDVICNSQESLKCMGR